jgi:hypothetical protein
MKKNTAKMSLYFLAISVISILLNSCACTCNDILCVSDTKPFSLKFSKVSFSENDLMALSIIRLDKSFNRVDTFQIDKLLNKDDYSISFFMIGEQYKSEFELKNYNYLIVNNSIDQVDSITDLTYDIETKSEVCSKCSGGINCKDQYYSKKEYLNPKFKINGIEESGFEIPVIKKKMKK